MDSRLVRRTKLSLSALPRSSQRALSDHVYAAGGFLPRLGD